VAGRHTSWQSGDNSCRKEGFTAQLVVVCHNTASNELGVLAGVPASWYGSLGALLIRNKPSKIPGGHRHTSRG
jgi:hypothetical protein